MIYVWGSKYTLIILLIALLSYYILKNGGDKQVILLIGILSSPDHFQQREVLRKTWLQDIGQDVVYYFLIGKNTCKIPVLDRVDEQSCTELPLFLPEVPDNHFFLSGNITCYYDNGDVSHYFGFSFIVQHDIVIKRIGVISNFFDQPVKIKLVEAITNFKITSATFLPFESSDIHILWQNVDNYKLPKGFEGRILMEQEPTSSFRKTNCGFNWNSAGNILAYQMFWISNSFPAQFRNLSLTPIVIAFDIPDFHLLNKFLIAKQNRSRTWKSKISDIQAKIDDELSNFGDILLLDVMDVYKLLPQKMLEFYKWAPDNVKFSFLLKTDDDTYINIQTVKEELYNLSQQNKGLLNQIWWWSDFREGWAVQRSGKWRETNYNSITYPPFPCGSGYILSRGTVMFLRSVVDNLFTGYQGEDVALGIWLAGVKPNSVVNKTQCLWICDKRTKEKSSVEFQKCNHPDLSPSEIKKIHSNENYTFH